MMYIIAVGFIGLIVGISTMIIITKRADKPEAGLIGGLIVAAITLIVLNLNRNDSPEQIHEKAQTYTIYIDGTKVDSEKININNYSLKKITVNDEKEEVYIAS